MFGTVDLTDEAVRAASEGSRTALTSLMEAVQPRIRAMVLVRLSPTPAQLHAVEDVTQEVLADLTAGISRLRCRTAAGLRAYLSGAVRHQVADVLRGRGRRGGSERPVRSLDSAVGDLSGAVPLWQFLSTGGASPRTEAERDEQAELLLAELGRLKREYRDVIVMAFFDQLPTSTIAEHMELSRPAASMLLIRAVRALRRNMGEAAGNGQRDVRAT
jgi:RNA polymerase sigma factor (sigma-70 family)